MRRIITSLSPRFFSSRLLLVEVEHHALVVVVGDLAKRIAVCVSGSRPHFSADTAMPALVWVWTTQCDSGRAAWIALWIT